MASPLTLVVTAKGGSQPASRTATADLEKPTVEFLWSPGMMIFEIV
jgi:hypothetical protein